LQTGSVHIATQEVGLDDVVSHTVANLPAARDVGLQFAEDLPPVRADAGLLDRVVENVVDNAVRHSAGALVTVRTSHFDGRVQLHVVDRGPGVPADDKERIFQPFQRLGDRAAREGAGVGLGLAVARGLTEAMGGRLLAEDTPGGGLTMVVDLPVAPAAEDDS
jgi:two-component system sensor histidine kinase KdpD